MQRNLNLEYNTQRGRLIISEYGRYIQKMVDYATGIEDVEKRKKVADELLQLMGQLNPHLRDIADYKHKLYDHLFIISDFKLDIESPYPKPSPESIQAKPAPLPYPGKKIRYRFYGKNIENMISEVKEREDGAFKTAYINAIGSFMKNSCRNWNDEMLTDEQIMNHLALLSEGKIVINEGEEVKFSAGQERRNFNQGGGGRNQQNRNFRNQNNRNRNQQNRNNGGGSGYRHFKNKPR